MSLLARIVMFAAAFAAVTVSASVLTPSGTPGPEITLAVQGKATAVIAVPEKPSALEQQAAEELRQGLKRITGADFVIRQGASAQSPAICLRTVEADAPAGLQPDGYSVAVKDGNLILTGGRGQGVMNAVLALLEEDLGCRWFGHYYDYYPHRPELRIRPVIRVDNPAFSWRNPFTYLSYNAEFCRRNRIARDDGFGFLPGWFCHTYEKIYSSQNFQEHPEYFMMDAKGQRDSHQLCPSNPTVRQLAIAAVRKVLAKNHDPKKRLVCVAENDTPIYCSCPTCRRTIAAHGNATVAPHLELVKAVADAIRPDYPDYRIVFICYHQTQKPPTGMTLPDNVIPWFCMTSSDNHPLVELSRDREVADNLRGWTRLGSQVMIWDYIVDFQNYFMPYPSFDSTADNLKIYRQDGCRGIMLQGRRESAGGDRPEMRAWVMAKLLWNPDRDLHELMRDFNRGVYGPAAPYLDQYDALIRQAGKEGKTIPQKYRLSDFIRQAQKLFDNGRQALIQAHRQDLLPRLELAQLPIVTLDLDRLTAQSKSSPADLQRVAQLLDFLSRVSVREHVTSYNERNTMAKYLADHQIWLDSRSGKGALTITPKELVCYRELGAEAVSDPRFTEWKPIRQRGNNTWSIQWDIPEQSLKPKTRYQLRALLRVEAAAPSGDVWIGGIYDNRAKSSFVKYAIPGSRLSATEYRWVDLGAPFVPRPDSYLWCAAVKKPGPPAQVFLAKLELVPVR